MGVSDAIDGALRRHRRAVPRAAAIALVSLVLLSPGAGSAAAPDEASQASKDEIARLVRELGGDADVAAVVADGLLGDPTGDQFHPSGVPSDLDLSILELLAAGAQEWRFGAPVHDAWFGGPLGCEAGNVICPETPAGSLTDDWYVFPMVVGGPIEPQAGLRCEFGGAFYDRTPIGNGTTGTFPNPTLPLYHLDDANVYWVIRSVDGAEWSLEMGQLQADGTTASLPTDARVVLGPPAGPGLVGQSPQGGGPSMLLMVEQAELDAFEFWRVFAFCADPAAFGDPSKTGVDAYPEPPGRGAPAPNGPVLQITREPGAEPQPTPTPTFPVDAPSPTPAATGASGGPSGGGGGIPVGLLLVLAGVPLVLIGGYLFLKDRGDPCADLLAAALAAEADCARAQAEAGRARAEAASLAAEAAAARAAAEATSRAREAAERGLELEEAGPDPGRSWAEGTLPSGRRLREDEFDLRLRDDAFAAEDARYRGERDAASSQAEREAAARAHEQRMGEIGRPEAIDDLRAAAARNREQRVRDGRAAVDRARAVEGDALAAAATAEAASAAASTAAGAAESRAAEICAGAAAAWAAYDACAGRARPTPPPDGPPGPPPPDGPPGPPDDGPGPGGGPIPPVKGGDVPGGPDGGLPPPIPPPGGTTPRPPERPRPPAPPTPPESSEPACQEGEETEVWEGEPRSFRIPVPGEKIRIRTSPHLQYLETVLDGYAPHDSDGNALTESGDDRGMPVDSFLRLGRDGIRQLFGPVERVNAQWTIEFVVPLMQVHLGCRRRLVCEGGRWSRRERRTATTGESKRVDVVARRDSAALRVNEIAVAYGEAVRALEAAVRDEEARVAFVRACEGG